MLVRLILGVGSQHAFENVDFAKTIYLSKFNEYIEEIDGIIGVHIEEFQR